MAIQTLDSSVDKIDIATAIKLRFEHNFTYKQIAAHFNVSPQNIHQRLSRFTRLIENSEDIKAYEVNKAKILTGAEMKLLDACLDEDAIKAASLNNRAYAFKQVFESNRLEQGKSTENLSIRSMTQSLGKDIEEISKRRAELMAKLDAPGPGDDTGK